MARIFDFLSKKYLKRAKSDDPAYSFAWSAALAFRNDKKLASYRDYLLSKFELSEEQLDGKYAGIALYSEITPNWGIAIELLIDAAANLDIPAQFISLAKLNESAAKLLFLNLKLLEEVEKYGRAMDHNDIVSSLNADKDILEGLPQGLSQDRFKEVIQLNRTERNHFYVQHNIDSKLRFIIEFTLISISDADDLAEPAVEEYHLLWASDKEEHNIELGVKLKLLESTLLMLDGVKSTGMQVNIMCLSSLLSVEHHPKAVSFIICAILARSRYIAAKYDDEFFVEKHFLEGSSKGQFLNNGAVFGSVLNAADRGLIVQAYKYMDKLDHSEVSNAVFCCEITTSAPVIDFLVDWATHFMSVDQEETARLVLDSLSRISQSLTDHQLVDGSFKGSDLWSDDTDQGSSGFSVPFREYMEKHNAKVHILLGSEAESTESHIEVCVSHPDDMLEIYRHKPLSQVWRLFIEGYYGESKYHMGFLEYSVARCVDGMWLMNACSRNECLDGVTQLDVDSHRLDDDQAQAVFDHGSLEAAQEFRYNRIVAASSSFDGKMSWRTAGGKLYDAVIAAGARPIL